MESSLTASATTAGQLFSGSTFVVPPYQREYAWGVEEVNEFWLDLRQAVGQQEYFLGLVIVTEDADRRHLVDGQQRMLTITLLAACLYHAANRHGRRALAERVEATFLTSIDYDTDAVIPRLSLADTFDEVTLRGLVATGQVNEPLPDHAEAISDKIVAAYSALSRRFEEDIAVDPFKRLGIWAEFLTDRLFMAVFVHPDSASAYRVFEVVNTRGRDLTTADLLKNFVISQTAPQDRDERYRAWQEMARPLNQAGSGALVQFIRHVVTLSAGHVLPRDLFDFIASRRRVGGDRRAPTVDELITSLEDHLPLYMQMVDPTLEGPASPEWIPVFEVLNELGILSVRPLLLAIARADEADAGMDRVLQLVVRRIVVGNLGTGNVERRFGDAAKATMEKGSWRKALAALSDLDPDVEDFKSRVAERSFNKATLTILRRSETQRVMKPQQVGVLHLIRPRQADWPHFPLDDFSFWGATLGNTVLAPLDRRPKGASTWDGFKANLLPDCLDTDKLTLTSAANWSTADVEDRGHRIADTLAQIWYRDAS